MNSKRFVGLLTLLLVAMTSFGQGIESFRLTEFVLNNTNGLVDEYDEHSPWLEISNSSWSSLELGGCYITNNLAAMNDKLSAPERIAMMNLIPRGDARTHIPPKAHIVFFADGKVNLGTLHLNFKLIPGKENVIALYEGNGVSMIDKVTVPATLPTNHSWSRFYDPNKKADVWMDCDSTKVTPNSANDNTQMKEDKVAEFKQKDPYGIAMTILSMGIVFFCLILLYVFFRVFGIFISKLNKKDANIAEAEAPVAEVPAKKSNDEMSTILAVISMALYEYEEDAHDDESGVITIVPSQSPWSSKGIVMVKRSK